MRSGPHPVVVGLPEKPYPGIEGITTSNASAGLAPCAVGSVSGAMILSCSMIEPGHPWVTMSGNASPCGDRTWMKWMSNPSISVTNWGRAFSLVSHLRQSYSVAQWCASSWVIASGTPCDWSDTVSRSGQRVAAIRRRSSVSSASGTSTRNGRISMAVSSVVLMVNLRLRASKGGTARRVDAVDDANTARLGRPFAPVVVTGVRLRTAHASAPRRFYASLRPSGG